jgi:S-adenosylmethionine:tRNA ribosyltransferase-isomerase
VSALAFKLPASLEAHEPPPERGAVRLLVAHRADGLIEHAHFSDLSELLGPGDLLVVNVSATIPAAVGGHKTDGSDVRVHFSTRTPGLGPEWRVVEVRSTDGARPQRARAGERIALPGGARLELVAPYASGARLMLAVFGGAVPVEDYLSHHGEPIRYGYVRERWPLGAYQNVYATTPGSAEMPSAGRPFTPELITTMIGQGILMAPITLHTGVSSPERHEAPFPEEFEVPDATARLVNAVHGWGGRVIAVGTTVVRALETAVGAEGRLASASGWTSLVVGRKRRLQAVDGLITGWHEPLASHLEMLEALAGPELLARSYESALDQGYRWHEFGDSHLIL